MATLDIKPLEFVKGNTELLTFPEAATQSFKRGELVYLDDTNGRVTACAANAQVILGIAAQDATGTTGEDINVQILYPGHRLKCQIYKTGDTSNSLMADSSNGDLAEYVVVDNVAMADIASVSVPCFRLIKRHENDVAADIYARVYVAVISTYLQADTATVS